MNTNWDWIEKLQELRGHPLVLVSVSHVTGSVPREPGAKMIVLGSGDFFGTIGGGTLEDLAKNHALSILENGIAETKRFPLGSSAHQCCGGMVELFFEPLNHGPELVIFGAGHVGQAVARTMVGTPFQITIVDERPEWIESHDLPSKIRKLSLNWRDALSKISFHSERTFAVVMTFSHDRDEEIIASLIERPTKFMGLIGSETKWDRFEKRLRERGIPGEALARVTCPIGFITGGKSPQEVAISLAAQLLSLHHGGRNVHTDHSRSRQQPEVWNAQGINPLEKSVSLRVADSMCD